MTAGGGGYRDRSLTVLASIAGVAAAIYLSAGQVVSVVGARWPEIVDAYGAVARCASGWAVPLDLATDQRRVAAGLAALMAGVHSFTTHLGFIAVLVMLGLPEAPHIWSRIEGELDARTRSDLGSMLVESAYRVRGYLGTTFATSALTGVCSTLLAFATGLDLALVWGLLNHVLNFVPVIGNIVGIIPPTLYAILQFDGLRKPLVVFAGFVVLQVVVSNVVYPLLQGKSLSLSPVAILLAMAFWSWLWGIAGALIAVPITAVAVILFDRFDRTRWFARLISRA